MHVVTLSDDARSMLAGQLPEVQSQAFFSAFPLVRTTDNVVVDTAQVMLKSDQADVSVAVTLFGHTTFTTVAKSGATPTRIEQLIEEHANASDFGHRPGEKIVLHAICDLKTVLNVAVTQLHGVFLLPVEVPELLLVITPSGRPAQRSIFHFVLCGRTLMMPVLLPSSLDVAVLLLEECTRRILCEIQGNEAGL